MDCDKLPDDCEFAIDHLVSDRENQVLDGFIHGFWRRKNEVNKITREGFWVRGRRHGLFREYFETGELQSEATYIWDKMDGIKTMWRRSGKKELEMGFKDGDYTGEYRSWNEEGILDEDGSRWLIDRMCWKWGEQ